MKEKDKKIVEQFKELLSQKISVREIRVFGSRVGSDSAEESDLGVLVVVDELDHKKEKWISECAWEAGFPNDVVVGRTCYIECRYPAKLAVERIRFYSECLS